MINKITDSIIPSTYADSPALPAGSDTHATTQAAPAPAQQPPTLTGMMMPFLLMFMVVYFLMIRPQQKKMKEQQTMLTTLKHGDEVITASGILGTITGITDKVVTLEIADDVKIKLIKSQVAQVVKGAIQ
jgi:preprotein translocase subunit YajC